MEFDYLTRDLNFWVSTFKVKNLRNRIREETTIIQFMLVGCLSGPYSEELQWMFAGREREREKRAEKIKYSKRI